ncbi:MAG: helix-turn-helix domain-containing protein [Cytophaga sp.]|uniref:helix-turn-helix domain-containing protein n=1 Tax=Cytophaga sp. TaxID=29535 RepID=UPI003F8228E0
MLLTQLNIILIIHAVCLGAVLFFKKNILPANKLLGAALLLMNFTYIDNISAFNHIPSKYPYLIHMDVGTLPAVGPLFYLYVRSMMGDTFRLNKKTFLHFIPSVLIFIAFLPFHFKPYTERIAYINNYYNELPTDIFLFSIFVFVQISIYMGMSILSLRRYQQRISTLPFSEFHQVNLTWLVQLLILLSVLNLILFPTVLMFPFMETLMYAPIVTASIYMIIVYKSLQQPLLTIPLQQLQSDLQETQKTDTSVPVTRNLQLPNELIERYIKKIDQSMNEQKLYLDPELTIKKMSDSTGIPTHHLSYVLNEEFKSNFFDFINKYRLEEFQQILTEKKNQFMKIEMLAYDCGFNSKATLYRVFKKKHHISPSEYRKALEKQNA